MAKITTLNGIKIRDIINTNEDGTTVIGYEDHAENGVTGMAGKLNIRPAYQREFVYDDKKRNAVINTITKYNAKALNPFWWAKNADGTYELMDGQQRTVSTCQYVNGDFAIDNKYFHNLTKDQRDAILDQEILVSVFEGNESEKLEWFRTINIAGEKLTEQEIRNAAYTGAWLADAKHYFSKTGCGAYGLGKDYLTGNAIRQDYLETVLDWISDGNIEKYMADHQHDENATGLWTYFQNVIAWIRQTFIEYRKEMKGLNWGRLYKEHNGTAYNVNDLEARVKTLMMDDEVTNKKGIYEYVLLEQKIHDASTRNTAEKCLSLRAFSDKQKREAYERQNGICPICGERFKYEDMDGDHDIPWSKCGKTTDDNCAMLCKKCNHEKSNRY